MSWKHTRGDILNKLEIIKSTMIISLIIIALIIVYIFGFYNKLRTIQVRIKASIQEIGNQLKRQSGLIPNLVESAKGYLKQEKAIFKMLTDARKIIDSATATNNPAKLDQSQDLITKALSSLNVIVESNPQLQSAGVVSGLMNELRDTADKLMYARRTLIDLSADYNTAIAVIPGVWLAPLFGFKEERGLATPVSGSHLQVSDTESETPKINLQ